MPYEPKSKIAMHRRWFDRESGNSGRLAYGVTSDDRFRVKQLAGCAPPANVLVNILIECEFIREEANAAHRSREKPYCAYSREGMSGSLDYILRIEGEPELLDYPPVASLHISMYGKLNEGVDLWIGDLPPLFEAWWADQRRQPPLPDEAWEDCRARPYDCTDPQDDIARHVFSVAEGAEAEFVLDILPDCSMEDLRRAAGLPD